MQLSCERRPLHADAGHDHGWNGAADRKPPGETSGHMPLSPPMQAAFPPGFAAARTPPSLKRRREPEELELEESRCGRYRPAGLDARVSSVALPALGCIRALAVGADGTVFACTDSALYAMLPAGQISMIAGSRSEMGHRDGTHFQNSKRHLSFYR